MSGLASLNFSREQILEQIGLMLGNPATPDKLKDYNEQHAKTLHFPDAYIGSNDKLRETITNLILEHQDAWMTGAVLPWRQTEGVDVEWDENKFDVRLMQRVPSEGVSRLTTSIRRRFYERQVRRGVGLIIESDFYMTAAGQKHFADSLKSIQMCVQETVNYDGMFALLTAPNYGFQDEIRRHRLPLHSIRQSMQRELSGYAACNKADNGLDRVIEVAKSRMKNYHVKPDTLIVPPSVSLFVSTMPERHTIYNQGGPSAVADMKAGIYGFEAKDFHGLRVYECHPFETGPTQDTVQMLTRQHMVGEKYVMQFPNPLSFTVSSSGATTATVTGDKHAEAANIYVYDEGMDRLRMVAYVEAVEKSGVFSDAALHKAVFLNPNDSNFNPKMLAALTATGASETQRTSLKTVGSAAFGVFTTLVENRGYFPLSIVLCRPFITHTTQSVIVTVSGEDTGRCLYGPSNMQLSANTQNKTIEGNFTCYTRAVVTQPKNVMVVPDVLTEAYVGGCGTEFFTKDELSGTFNGSSTLEQGDTSFIAIPVPSWAPNLRDNPEPTSLSGKAFYWSDAPDSGKVDDKYFYKVPGLFDAVKTYWGFANMHNHENPRETSSNAFLQSGDVYNHLCFPGPYRYAKVDDGKCVPVFSPGVGHWGEDALPGDAKMRRGESCLKEEGRLVASVTMTKELAF